MGHYLHRLSDENFRRILHNDGFLLKFSGILIENYRVERIEDVLDIFWENLERMNNLDNFLSLIKRVETVRQNLLDSLDRSKEEIRKTYRLTNLGRLLGSAVYVVGKVGGLLMQDSYPGYANWAFRAATIFELLGMACFFSEMVALNNTLRDLMEKIKYNQEVWYQQTEELYLTVQSVFQFHESSRVIEVFTNASNATISPAQTLAKIIRLTSEQDISQLRDEGWMRNLINLSTHLEFQVLLKW